MPLPDLTNLASLLVPFDDVIVRDKAVPSFHSGMRSALLFAEALIPLNTAPYVSICGFSHYKTTGLFFSSEITDQCAKVSAHPVGDGVMMFLGKRTDFDFPSRAARDDLEPICFNENEIAFYAKKAADHLAQQATISDLERNAWRNRQEN